MLHGRLIISKPGGGKETRLVVPETGFPSSVDQP